MISFAIMLLNTQRMVVYKDTGFNVKRITIKQKAKL